VTILNARFAGPDRERTIGQLREWMAD
jgi:hypothetical protein